MRRSRSRRVPLWKQAIAISCLLYVMLVWVLPVFMLPFVNMLPFEHEKSLLERLPFSIAGSTLLVLALLVLNGGRLPGSPRRESSLQSARHWLAVGAGLTMFTVAGAALSANLFGSLSMILPGKSFRQQTTLSIVAPSGSRYKSLKVEYNDVEIGSPRYLILSKRLFDYPDLRSGSQVVLGGKETAIGRYIESVVIIP